MVMKSFVKYGVLRRGVVLNVFELERRFSWDILIYELMTDLGLVLDFIEDPALVPRRRVPQGFRGHTSGSKRLITFQ